MTTGYRLYGPDIEPGRGEIFRISPNPRVHPSSYTIGTGSFSGVNLPGRGVDHLPHPAPKLKSKTILLLPLWVFVACSRVNFTVIRLFGLEN
jgi:hypothetical protein